MPMRHAKAPRTTRAPAVRFRTVRTAVAWELEEDSRRRRWSATEDS